MHKYPHISYTTKEEAKAEDEAAFLALSPSERVMAFLRLCEAMKGFQSPKEENSENFIIERKTKIKN